jgi:hypothetical protein
MRMVRNTSPAVVSLLAVSTLLAACAPRPFATVPTAASALEVREAAFLGALAARDADAVAVHFTDDGVLHIANMPPVRGRPAIRQFYANVLVAAYSISSNQAEARTLPRSLE